ncbi:unnamed protein product [Chondrus crispus]|uniref:Uncharacterized protein n=1 Tax=Chondrus crispus TaxID=2769 RepID=R7QN64_CHOCR|nr:unnamed protein product [Chondrus crispus]CDF38830.1 unnamed protein product [Chondrus crispus]|eukprot:XP_005718735.1 unnamed protein product [Chondrus crispus]
MRVNAVHVYQSTTKANRNPRATALQQHNPLLAQQDAPRDVVPSKVRYVTQTESKIEPFPGFTPLLPSLPLLQTCCDSCKRKPHHTCSENISPNQRTPGQLSLESSERY